MAIHNLIDDDLPINSDTFFNELHYLWDIYSEEAIVKQYHFLKEKGNMV